MKRAVLTVLFLAFVSVLPFQIAQAMPNVHLDNTKTTITLHETVNFTAQASYSANITWYCDGINVQSDFSAASNYTFIPRAVGVYFVKLSVDGFTNPPPIGAIKVTVTESGVTASESPPFEFVTPWVWESPPNLNIESPKNGSYTGIVTLNFTVEAPSYWLNNQNVNWNDFNQKETAIEQKLKSITYVLDGYLTTIPVNSNLCKPYKDSIELANLTEGTHQLIVYTNDTGVYRSIRGFFTQTQINNPSETVIDFNFIPTPTPTVQEFSWLVVIALIVGTLSVALIRHRKPAN